MSTSDANSGTGSQSDSVSATFPNHGVNGEVQDESKSRIELVTSGLTPEFIQQITSAVEEEKSLTGKKRTADEANEPLDLRGLFYSIKDSVPNCTDDLIEKNIRILNEHNINVMLIPLLNQTTALAMSLDLGLLLAAQLELQKQVSSSNKKPKLASPPREISSKTVEERIKSNPKLMERFPRDGDFEIVNPKTVRCNICKKDIHLASEGSLSRLIEHVYGKFSKTRVTTTPQHLAKLLKRDYMLSNAVVLNVPSSGSDAAKSTEERVPSTVAPPPMQNISPLDLEKILQHATAPFISNNNNSANTVAINKQDRYVKKLRELRREFSKEQNQILCYCLKPALKHFTKSGEMFWTCQKWKSEGDCLFTRFDMPLDQLSDDEQIDDEIPLTEV